MLPLFDLRKNTRYPVSRVSNEAVENCGDESLIFDPRSRVKPIELVEQKLQIAMNCDQMRVSRFAAANSN